VMDRTRRQCVDSGWLVSVGGGERQGRRHSTTSVSVRAVDRSSSGLIWLDGAEPDGAHCVYISERTGSASPGILRKLRRGQRSLGVLGAHCGTAWSPIEHARNDARRGSAHYGISPAGRYSEDPAQKTLLRCPSMLRPRRAAFGR
jgi:hypothetical protein